MTVHNRYVGEAPQEDCQLEGRKTERRRGRHCRASKVCCCCSKTQLGQSEADRRHQVLPSRRKRSEPEIHLVCWRCSLEACVEIGGPDFQRKSLQKGVRHPHPRVGCSCGCVRRSC